MPVALGYDKRSPYHDLLLGLPYREATGLLTRDVAKPNHGDVDLNGPPTWASEASGLGVLEFNAATASEYLDCPAADTVDLDFTTEDYTIACWIYPEFIAQSKMIIARYELDNSGWELYMYDSAPRVLQLRHHHASAAPAPTRTGQYSVGWFENFWYFMVMTRSGINSQHYRNGVAVLTVGDDLVDPDTCNRDLVIGCRFTKDSDWYNGKMWYPRVWPRELSHEEIRFLFETERHWFGV